jgi:hypothetical protein
MKRPFWVPWLLASALICALTVLACDWENSAGDNMESRYVSPVKSLITVIPTVIAASDDTDGANLPGNTADGDLNTYWLTTQLTHWAHYDLALAEAGGDVYDGYRHWITIDLGEIRPRLSKLELHRRIDGAGGAIVKAEIYASEEVNLKINVEPAVNAGKARKVGEASNWPMSAGSSGNWNSPVIFTGDGSEGGTPATVSARYIQLRSLHSNTASVDKTNYTASVQEIRLYELDEEGNESVVVYSPNANAFACCVNRDRQTSVPSNVINGDLTSSAAQVWISGGINTNTAGANLAFLKARQPADYHFDVAHWITLDLGSVRDNILSLKVHNRRDSAVGNISAMDVYASENFIDPDQAENPGMILAKSVNRLSWAQASATTETWKTVAFTEPIKARYLHIRVTSDEFSGTGGTNFTNFGYAAAAEFQVLLVEGEYPGIDLSYLGEAYAEGLKKLAKMDPSVYSYVFLRNGLNAAKETLATPVDSTLTVPELLAIQETIDAQATSLWDLIYSMFPPNQPPEVIF